MLSSWRVCGAISCDVVHSWWTFSMDLSACKPAWRWEDLKISKKSFKNFFIAFHLFMIRLAGTRCMATSAAVVSCDDWSQHYRRWFNGKIIVCCAAARDRRCVVARLTKARALPPLGVETLRDVLDLLRVLVAFLFEWFDGLFQAVCVEFVSRSVREVRRKKIVCMSLTFLLISCHSTFELVIRVFLFPSLLCSRPMSRRFASASRSLPSALCSALLDTVLCVGRERNEIWNEKWNHSKKNGEN